MGSRDVSIGRRLGVGFGFIFALLVAEVAGTGAVVERFRTLRNAREIAFTRAELAEDIGRDVLAASVAARTHALMGDDASIAEFERQVSQGEASASTLLGAMPEDPRAKALPYLLQSYAAAGRLLLHAQGDALIDAERDFSRERVRATMAAHEVEALWREADGRAQHATRHNEQVMVGLLFGLCAAVLVTAALAAWRTVVAVRTPTLALVRAARALEAGDFAPALAMRERRAEPPADELRELSAAFGRTAETLATREARTAAEAAVMAAVSASLEAGHLAQDGLRAIVAYLGCEIGAVYVVAEPGVLRRAAAWALDGAEERVAFGEGLVGQAAQSREPTAVRDIPAGAPWRIRLGFDDLAPREVHAYPVIFGDTILGVLLVGGLRPLDPGQRDFAERAAGVLAIALQNAGSHAEVRRLAAALAGSNQELARQNEELQAQREEIQMQNEELRAQAEELRAQSDELQSRSTELEERVSEAAHLEEELRRRAEALTRADHRKDEFLAMLAHELRNPLGALSNAVHLLKLLPPEPRLTRLHDVMQRQVRYQARLLDDLLDTSRIARGRIELQRERLDLCELLRQATDDHRTELERGGRELSLELPATSVWVEGDRTRLTQVLGNLLHNSLKFTKQGDRVTVSLQANDGQASFSVRDTGAGIEAQLLPRIFESFTQGDGGLDRRHGGLGLGLSLVKALVELHGGQVRAKSDGPGRGCEVCAVLPLACGPREVSVTAVASSAAPRCRVLVVEDNHDAAQSLCDLLQSSGHEVAVAATGPDGLELARHLQPDVVFCDLGLPGMDGFAVARELRGDRRTAAARLIALSGYGGEETRRRSREVGFDLHLTKPVEPAELERILAAMRSPAMLEGSA